MGSGGGGSGLTAGKGGKVKHDPFTSRGVPSVDTSRYSIEWENPYRGSVSRRTANEIYKANKAGDISVLPETISQLYDEAASRSPMVVKQQRYNQDHLYYDQLETATQALINKDFRSAQRIINWLENDSIKRAGRKSPFYKYVKQLN